MEYFLFPKNFVTTQDLIKCFEDLLFCEIIFVDKFSPHLIFQSSFIAVLHKNIEVILTEALEW